MANVTMRQMLEAGLHFGHQTRRWNPNNPDSPYDGLDPDDIPEAPDMGMMPDEGQKTDLRVCSPAPRRSSESAPPRPCWAPLHPKGRR